MESIEENRQGKVQRKLYKSRKALEIKKHDDI